MPKQQYPKWLYHAGDPAATPPVPPSSQLVQTEDQHDALRAQGWAESPGEARGDAPPAVVDPEAPYPGDVPKAVREAPPKQEYPKWLYHATAGTKLVASPTEHDELGPEWCESPTEATKVFNAARGIVTPDVRETASAGAGAPVSTADDPAITKMNVTDAVTAINAVESLEVLARLYQQEEGGANRKTVQTAIGNRINALAKAAASPSAPPEPVE